MTKPPSSKLNKSQYTIRIQRLEGERSRLGRKPGLVVIGGDSWPEGCGFESQHHLLEGLFSHRYTSCKNCNVGLKRRK